MDKEKETISIKEILNQYYKEHIEVNPLFEEWNTYNLLWIFYLTTRWWTVTSYQKDDHIEVVSSKHYVSLKFIFNPWSVIVSENWKIQVIDKIEQLIWLTYRFN